MLTYETEEEMKKSKLLVAAIILVSVTILTFTCLYGGKKLNSKLKLVFFELSSKGNATLVETIDEKGNTIYGLIDGGKPISYLEHVEPYLKENNISKINFLVVSHMDVDHVGGIEELLKSDYVDSETTLYLKATSKSKGLIANAQSKGMNVGIVEPLSAPDNIKTKSEVMQAPDAVFKTQIKHYSKTDNYAASNISDNITYGDFTITFFNGVDWNSQDVVDEDWDENVNSLTCLLERKNSKDDLQRIYIGSDLGENSSEDSTEEHQQYSMVIGERVSQLVGPVDVYLVAHHGFYYSMNDETARNLSFQYAIVTNSYNEIAYKGIKKFQKKNSSLSDSEALNIGSNTLQALFSSNRLSKVFFTDGENYGTPTAYEIIDKCQPTGGYVVTDDNGCIKKGNITVELGSDINISQ